jgi:predicted phage tail protein
MFFALLALSSAPPVAAQDDAAENSEAVIERANHLKELLDKLLTQSNHSSIQRTLTNGSHDNDPLIEEALQLKADGERALEEGDHLRAAMTLQAALDKVFQAIRSDDEEEGEAARLSARLSEAVAANDAFLSAATRVLSDEPDSSAAMHLEEARAARTRADSSVASGDTEAALQELNASSRHAQDAIRKVRDGKVIERGH